MRREENIIGIAIKTDDGEVHSLPKPARHMHLFANNPSWTGDGEQGFVTSTGRFVTRWQALRIAVAAKQCEFKLLRRSGGELFSEDVW